jgi:adenine-specific DNA-methyltransferase
MKYMGSKRMMLKNGLGTLLRKELCNCNRVVDLFCGAASISWFCAEKSQKPVLATDLQLYATVLAEAVISRTCVLDVNEMNDKWLSQILPILESYSVWPKARQLDGKKFNTVTWSKRAKELCKEEADSAGPIWKAYGGHYFSPTQALIFDAMLEALPKETIANTVCLASAIISASKCAASPGHTAQPFKANRTAGQYLREAWLRSPIVYAEKSLEMLCSKHAREVGEARVGDANKICLDINDDDLVFIDPPYSGVHYSRFYHVLETIARGNCSMVEGVGRYPPSDERPVSKYSRKTESLKAMEELISTLSEKGCTVIITFPTGQCSNGLSGEDVESFARTRFIVKRKDVTSRFSTLGGNNFHRSARKVSDEMILLLRPN